MSFVRILTDFITKFYSSDSFRFSVILKNFFSVKSKSDLATNQDNLSKQFIERTEQNAVELRVYTPVLL